MFYFTVRIITPLLLLLFAIEVMAQNTLLPESGSFNTKIIKSTKQEMTCFAVNNGQKSEVSTFDFEINLNAKSLAVYTTLTPLNSQAKWIDTSVVDAVTLKPLYRSSYNTSHELILNYGKEVTGYNYNKQTNKKTKIKESVTEPFFDSYIYPYLLACLPLSQGYKGKIPVYDYAPESNNNIKSVIIRDVQSNVYQSPVTGDHKVWQVGIDEEATGERYEYFIDKETHRIWRIDLFTSTRQLYMFIDKELDFNPFKTVFNKEETLKLIKSGNSSITGQAFARDNQSGIRGVAIFNVNKKQYAQPGIKIILIPYTGYFKEWEMLNTKLRKKGRSVPLSKEAAECIKTTVVNDDEGHFEFTGLMPGEYLLYSEFEYEHGASYTEVIGYTDVYLDGMYIGSTTDTQSHDYTADIKATVKKVVSIRKDGEKIAVKLKKTL